MDYQLITFSKDNFPDQNVWDLCDEQIETHLSRVGSGIAIILPVEMTSGVDLLNWLSKWQDKCEEANKRFFIITEDADQQECIEFSHPDLNLVYFSSKEEFFNANPEFSPNTHKKKSNEVSSKPVFDFNYNSIPPNVEDKISYPEVVKDDSNDVVFNTIDQTETTDDLSTIHEGITETIKKDIDILIEEKINDYFEKRSKHVHTSDDQNKTQKEKSLQESDIDDSEKIVSQNSIYEASRTLVDIGSVIEVAGEYECCKCNYKRMYIKGDIADKCINPECLSSLSGWRLSFDLF